MDFSEKGIGYTSAWAPNFKITITYSVLFTVINILVVGTTEREVKTPPQFMQVFVEIHTLLVFST